MSAPKSGGGVREAFGGFRGGEATCFCRASMLFGEETITRAKLAQELRRLIEQMNPPDSIPRHFAVPMLMDCVRPDNLASCDT